MLAKIMALLTPLVSLLNKIFSIFTKSSAKEGLKELDSEVERRKKLEKDPNKRPPR